MDETVKKIASNCLYYSFKNYDLNIKENRLCLWQYFVDYLPFCWKGMAFENDDFELYGVYDNALSIEPSNVIVISKNDELSVFGLPFDI